METETWRNFASGEKQILLMEQDEFEWMLN